MGPGAFQPAAIVWVWCSARVPRIAARLIGRRECDIWEGLASAPLTLPAVQAELGEYRRTATVSSPDAGTGAAAYRLKSAAEGD